MRMIFFDRLPDKNQIGWVPAVFVKFDYETKGVTGNDTINELIKYRNNWKGIGIFILLFILAGENDTINI